MRLGCRAPRLVKFSKRRERDRQLRRPYFKRSNSTFARTNTRTNGSPPSFRTSIVRLIWFFALNPVPDHFDRDCPRFRFGLLLTAVYLALLIMQAAAAFYNVEMITWHRKHHCFPRQNYSGGLNRTTETTRSWDCGVLADQSCVRLAPRAIVLRFFCAEMWSLNVRGFERRRCMSFSEYQNPLPCLSRT